MSADGNDIPTAKRPPWRPTKYDPAFCDQVIEMGEQGMSKAEIAYELRVGRTTIQRWEAEHEDFRVAMAHAKDAEQAWWERKGRTNIEAQHFQASMWSRSMAARFPDDWRETSRQEQSGPGGKPIEQNHTITWKVVKPTHLEPPKD